MPEMGNTTTHAHKIIKNEKEHLRLNRNSMYKQGRQFSYQ